MNKRLFFFIGPIICFAAIIIFAASRCPSDLKLEQIQTEIITYTRDEYCPLSCKMISAEIDGITYYVQENAYSEKYANDIIYEIALAAKKIRSEKELSDVVSCNDLKVFVLNNVSDSTKQSLIITRDSFENKEYRYDLFLKLTGFSRGNKSYGLCSYVFGDDSNTGNIKEYIWESDTESFLDMFFLRGDRLVSGDDSATRYLQFVSNLTAYLIDTKGMDVFINNPITVADVKDWILFLGIDCTLDDNDVCSLDDSLVLHDSLYEVHIKIDRFDIVVDNYESLNTTVDELAHLVKSMRVFDADATEYLGSEGISSETFSWPVIVKISTIGGSDHMSNCVIQYDKNDIVITLNYLANATLAHEISHIYIGNVPDEKSWMNEGFAQYFSYIKFISPDLRNSFYEAITSDIPDVDIKDYYLSVRDFPDSSKDVDVKVCMDAYILKFWNGDSDIAKRGMFSTPIYLLNGNEWRVEGDELSYNEAMLFIAYLIDRYSFKTTWDCMVDNKDYEEAFGEPYKKLKVDWIESVYNP